jgi:two-component system sensor histidine kinase BaeS
LLASIVDDLRDIGLAEAGQLPLETRRVDLVASAREAVDAMRGAQCQAMIEGPSGTPVFAIADARRLQQVLRNLLHNAITHTDAGDSIIVSVRCEGGEAGVIVTDTGRGIPPAHLSLVWERFHRVDDSRDRASGGRGLGLAIVRQFVEAMRGRVAVASVEGKGSSFEVWLPIG